MDCEPSSVIRLDIELDSNPTKWPIPKGPSHGVYTILESSGIPHNGHISDSRAPPSTSRIRRLISDGSVGLQRYTHDNYPKNTQTNKTLGVGVPPSTTEDVEAALGPEEGRAPATTKESGEGGSLGVNRSRSTNLWCLSSILILVIRLLLDLEPLAYLIHSIIVFLDMILIHLFTNCLWLSICGEITTIVFFLAFHYTKQTVFELLETTLIAMLCSFHLITSRNKHIHREEILECAVKRLSHHQSQRMQAEGIVNVDDSFFGRHSEHKKRMLGWGATLFEHFLDGSAGVMYTSFLGLIITEFVTYGMEKK